MSQSQGRSSQQQQLTKPVARSSPTPIPLDSKALQQVAGGVEASAPYRGW